MKTYSITIESGDVTETFRVQANMQISAEVSAMRKFYSIAGEEHKETAFVTNTVEIQQNDCGL